MKPKGPYKIVEYYFVRKYEFSIHITMKAVSVLLSKKGFQFIKYEITVSQKKLFHNTRIIKRKSLSAHKLNLNSIPIGGEGLDSPPSPPPTMYFSQGAPNT